MKPVPQHALRANGVLGIWVDTVGDDDVAFESHKLVRLSEEAIHSIVYGAEDRMYEYEVRARGYRERWSGRVRF